MCPIEINYYISELMEIMDIKDTEKILAHKGENYYDFFDEWKALGYPGTIMAGHAQKIIYDSLLSGKPMYENAPYPYVYKLSDNAKEIRDFANLMYDYVVYLQIGNKLSGRASNYFGSLDTFLKENQVTIDENFSEV